MPFALEDTDDAIAAGDVSGTAIFGRNGAVERDVEPVLRGVGIEACRIGGAVGTADSFLDVLGAGLRL